MTYKCTALAAVITYTLQHSKSQRPNSTKPNMGNEQDVTKLSGWHHQNIPVVNDKRSSYLLPNNNKLRFYRAVPSVTSSSKACNYK